ncbi:TPA: hypothetical protein ACGW5B_005531 [Bacillus paranthracis]|uniref:hypothetical protein n=1 Tax=Bacillus TaxID=1386 RepID=UPI00027CCB2B|nr:MULTISPECIES: hypothetical protein [unclassified Bacillus cereus group]AFQ13279.1 hypothetical protein BCK_27353 [Bacillus cereus FRI-35]MDX5839901.1 hypothetical protein [Bacillus cereus group sp. BfR-BA-01700]MDX5846233.1 hypothetical protein [Bacillus cereus group sp. BfR-BA-01233]MDX5941853.1 hypothetical protein [Bacillus cereus group sp. BfR-BA-00415]
MVRKIELKHVNEIVENDTYEGFKELAIQIISGGRPMSLVHVLLNKEGNVEDTHFKGKGTAYTTRDKFNKYERSIKKYIDTEEFETQLSTIETTKINEFELFKRYKKKRSLLENKTEIFYVKEEMRSYYFLSFYKENNGTTKAVTYLFDNFLNGAEKTLRGEEFIEELKEKGYNLTEMNNKDEIEAIIKNQS